MPRRTAALTLFIVLTACSNPGPDMAADAIPEISAHQQRIIRRSELKWQWPLLVGIGAIGCDGGAVIFRSAGKSYALNDAAAARGFANVRPITQSLPSGPPRNPLLRIKQHERMQLFAQLMRCEPDVSGESGVCTKAIRDRRGLSEDELKQIEVEGRERSWPPLDRDTRASLEPLIDAGLKLCPAL